MKKPTPEPTLEPIVYEGIDMESTLSGQEWINTFVDVIDECKIVVYNDETNKKVIVEDGQDVEFEEGDVLLLYTPTGMTASGSKSNCVQSVRGYGMYYHEVIFKEDVRKNSTINFLIFNDYTDELFEMNCGLILK